MFPFDSFGSSNDDLGLDSNDQYPEADPAASYPESVDLINHGTGEVLSYGDVWVDNAGGIYIESKDYVEGNDPLRVDPLATPGQTSVNIYNAEELGHLPSFSGEAVSDDLAAYDVGSVDAASAVEANDEGNDYDAETVAGGSFDSSDSSSYPSYDSSSSDWSSSTSSADSVDSGWDSSSSDWSSDSDYDSSSEW